MIKEGNAKDLCCNGKQLDNPCHSDQADDPFSGSYDLRNIHQDRYYVRKDFEDNSSTLTKLHDVADIRNSKEHTIMKNIPSHEGGYYDRVCIDHRSPHGDRIVNNGLDSGNTVKIEPSEKWSEDINIFRKDLTLNLTEAPVKAEVIEPGYFEINHLEQASHGIYDERYNNILYTGNNQIYTNYGHNSISTSNAKLTSFESKKKNNSLRGETHTNNQTHSRHDDYTQPHDVYQQRAIMAASDDIVQSDDSQSMSQRDNDVITDGNNDNDDKNSSKSILSDSLYKPSPSDEEDAYEDDLNDEKLNENSTGVKTERPYVCDICSSTFILEMHLKNHQKFLPELNGFRCSHPTFKSFQCSQCDFITHKSSNLTVHLRMHTGAKPYCCNFCDFKTGVRSHLVVHNRTHSGIKPYCCNQCDYKAITSSNLKLHMRFHTREKPFLCKLCDYRASSGSALSVHLRRHTGEKPFSCPKCEYTAISNTHIKRHLESHNNDKVMKCPKCEYTTSAKFSLKLHKMTHGVNKRYKCELCNFQTAGKGHYTIHMRKHETNIQNHSTDIIEKNVTNTNVEKVNRLDDSHAIAAIVKTEQLDEPS